MCFFIKKEKPNTELLETECNKLVQELDLAIGAANSYFVNKDLIIESTVSDLWFEKYKHLAENVEKRALNKYKRCSKKNELSKKAIIYSKIVNTLEDNINAHNFHIERENECNLVLDEINEAIGEKEVVFLDENSYIDISFADEWLKKHSSLLNTVKINSLIKYEKCTNGKEYEKKALEIQSIPVSLRTNIFKHNHDLATRQIDEGYRLIGDVEGRKLDRQQMLSIVKPSRNCLIIAGAGTGKTTTIVGKIKYLLKKELYKPEDILVLSFTNASASEMSERIHKETGCPIAASTFHKLGLEIIKSVEGVVPKIYSKSVNTFVREQLQSLMNDSDYLDKLCEYAMYYRSAERSESDFSSQEEYRDYLASNTPTTMKKEYVKSYGELEIANYLYQNQIEYEYEASYKFDTNTAEYGQYHPDFYLPDYDIYIEFFGIDREGKVAVFFKGRDGASASETYRAGMEWKRKIHSEKNTKMIECYQYEKNEGTLLSNLRNNLIANCVTLNPLPAEELWDSISEENSSLLDGVIELFGTVISLIKSNNYTFDYVEKLASRNRDSRNNLHILSLIKPIYEAYDKMLISNNEIDFNDMINIATSYVRDGKYANSYKFVIVDEYQDISKARYNLLKELRNSSSYELFCVGDDWQSIYRFAGSDINYIVDFEKYWGPSEIGRIETTYRFTNSLIDISSNFVMANPKQLRKSIRGKSNDARFSLGKTTAYTEAIAIQFMVGTLDDLPKGASVFFLGRYSFDDKLLKDCNDLNVRYDNANSDTIVTYGKRPDLNMKFMTVHRSKGLQADYVYIVNNKDAKMGFPSKIQDASIMDLLLEKAEVYPYAEERRLFYVALTRAKTKVYLVTVENKESIFVKELEKKYAKELKDERFTCPECGGRLIKRSGQYGEFYGCSNYSKNGCKYKRKIMAYTGSRING